MVCQMKWLQTSVMDKMPYKSKKLPCVQSGYCCTVAPCCYGRINSKSEKVDKLESGWRQSTIDTECVHLARPNDVGQRKCLIYKEIKEAEEMSEFPYPMMGSGCGSPLFNEVRTQVIDNMEFSNGQKNKILHKEESKKSQ